MCQGSRGMGQVLQDTISAEAMFEMAGTRLTLERRPSSSSVQISSGSGDLTVSAAGAALNGKEGVSGVITIGPYYHQYWSKIEGS